MAKSNIRSRPVIAWDGEGLESPDGVPQPYVLFANSQGNYIEAEGGLSTRACLDLMWAEFQLHPKHAIHVIFSGSYDANQILKHLSFEEASDLWEGYGIRVGPYIVEYVGRKYMKLTRAKKTMVLWDIFGFYQSSFVIALEKNVPGFHGLGVIREQKARRSIFTWGEIELIRKYCFLELEAMVELVNVLQFDLQTSGINLKRFHGAGAIAGEMLRMNNAKDTITALSPDIEEAGCYAYAGGRIELWQIGNHVGDIHVYDINSAYPAAIAALPSLAHGGWVRVLSRSPGVFGMYRVRYDFPAGRRGYPFFYRTPGGGILFPATGEGWYHGCELDAADATGNTEYEILDGYEFLAEDVKPYVWVQEYYDRRAEYKAKGMGAEKCLKLGLNSLYGKFAQSVGDKRPPYHSVVYAGAITAYCRSRIFALAMQKPESVVYIATDGIACLEPLDCVQSKKLGEWDYKKYDRVLTAQAGVYFLWKGNEREDKYRGFDRGAIDPDRIMAGWAKGEDSYGAPSTRFITFGSALVSRTWWSKHRTWRTILRDLRLDGGGGKRYVPHGTKRYRPDMSLVPLRPKENFDPAISRIYIREWEAAESQNIDGVPEHIYQSERIEEHEPE